MLTLKKLGIEDIVHFDYMDPPAPETLMRALEQLNYLGALDDEGELTPVGKAMTELPVDPLHSKILLSASTDFQCVNEALSIVACLNVPNIFIRPRDQAEIADREKMKFAHPDGDHITYLNVFNTFKAKDMDQNWCWSSYLNFRALKQANDIREQLIRILASQRWSLDSSPTSHPDYYTKIKKAVLAGYFMQTALLQRSGHYQTLKDDQVVMIHPSTVIDNKPEWVLYNEFVLTSRNYIRTVTTIRPEWLFEVAPAYFDLTEFKNNETFRKLERV